MRGLMIASNLPSYQDVFAGIGSGIISLKRLGIDIKKIIHVEHDPIASHGKHTWSKFPEAS